MAGELHSPPDDGARAWADEVESEQVRADALADRIAAYAPAGSDLRVVPGSLEAEVARLRGSLAWIAHYGTHNGDLRDGWAEAMRAIAHSALRLDPLNCSLCAAGHVPKQPCGEEPGRGPAFEALMAAMAGNVTCKSEEYGSGCSGPEVDLPVVLADLASLGWRLVPGGAES